MIHKFLLPIILICFATFLKGQVTTQEVLFDYQIAYCVPTTFSTAWIGEKVVIMIENESPEDRDSNIMSSLVNIFGDIIVKYEELTGLYDLALASAFDGKPVIEVVIDNCGAGGLANHGVLGMSTGKFFLDQFYDLVAQGNVEVPQVFLYELNRNFWAAGMDGFNGKFDWAMNDEPQNYGWWTVGMNNAQAYIIPKSLDIGMHYFGSGIDYWENRMVKELTDYMDDSQYDFDYGWRQALMPWHNTESINDMMSGLIIYSYNNFGGEDWIKGFYKYIQDEDIPNRSDVFAYQECRDNIYKIWSYAADENLISFFEDDLRWIISSEAKLCVETFFNTTNIVDLDEEDFYIYPNPTSDNLYIEKEKGFIGVISVHNILGQTLIEKNINASQINISLHTFEQGLYYLKIGDEGIPIIKN